VRLIAHPTLYPQFSFSLDLLRWILQADIASLASIVGCVLSKITQILGSSAKAIFDPLN
jgi:hypothetical protein